MFANIHIDVKFFKEAESDLILPKRFALSSQKTEFFRLCLFSNISVCLEKSSILTTFNHFFRKNKVRFEIVSIFTSICIAPMGRSDFKLHIMSTAKTSRCGKLAVLGVSPMLFFCGVDMDRLLKNLKKFWGKMSRHRCPTFSYV